MEGAILSTQSNNRFRTHLKNAATVLCARAFPKAKCSEATASCSKHHTYPRTTPPKRTSISCRMEPFMCEVPKATSFKQAEAVQNDVIPPTTSKTNGVVKLKSALAREVAHAWECRIGPPDQPAPAHRVQGLFNDIELYPTKTQVFEMLVCARQCARRKSLILTFGEFCVFAAELRRCSRQTRQTSKPESPVWSIEKEFRDKDSICKHVNGSEASPPPCEVFLGGSCNPTTWRSDIAIPMLEKMGITYFNPQVDDWSTELIEVEHRAKAEARALLFVLDSETRAVAACVEAAHLAAAPRDLLLVLRPYSRHQTIGSETISDQEYIELSRARATLQEAVERRGLPAFTDIPTALRCARTVLRGARTHPRHPLGHTILRLKRAYDAAGGRNGRLTRARAVEALKDATRVPRDLAEHCLPPNADTIDFETFCRVAEFAADSEYHSRNGTETATTEPVSPSAAERVSSSPREHSRLRVHNPRLRAYGQKLSLKIPKNGGNRSGVEEGTSGGSSGDSAFTPGTERRLERLPSMLAAPTHDVYLGGAFPTNSTRPEEILRREGFTYVIPRANDYTRMFSAPARRTAPAPDSPCRDKKPRPDTSPASPCRDKKPCPDTRTPSPPPDVELRHRTPDCDRPVDRLSASDYYTVTEDVTPQPFKGTYDEEQLLGSRVLVFALSAEAPSFSAMVLAAHYMGLRAPHTVLLVQPLDPARAHPYSEVAVRDYNRGRHYLTDLARRAGVPVFDAVDDAMACVLARLRQT
ncbi:uncharacterized protein raw isoform X2 [Maniola hyperantus]|uniref:uncharacterized protein raw isoform X2 n=1 Tax=Aphantopus hyperantus TaxID=2795564 RepID=UPI0015698762|nr:uncharacterized protein LOC117981903 isoform X2 [Maniola hyperantus]